MNQLDNAVLAKYGTMSYCFTIMDTDDGTAAELTIAGVQECCTPAFDTIQGAIDALVLWLQNTAQVQP